MKVRTSIPKVRRRSESASQRWSTPSSRPLFPLLAWPLRPEPTRKEVRALLALTDSAVEAVKSIISSSDEASETSGLRMVAEREGTQANFHLDVVTLPAEDDEVIDEQGARVFLEPEAASLLDDKVLDASVEQDQVAFTIADQVEEEPEEF
jgi:iron-sulfur cluster assembly protein